MQNQKHLQLIEQFGSKSIIRKLDHFVTPCRKQRIKNVLDSRLNSIHLAIEAPCDINNALATTRSSEIFGISTVHIINPEGPAGSVKRITQGAYYWIEVLYHDDLNAFLQYAAEKKLSLAGGTVQATTPLQQVPVDQPICFIIGNEQRGLSAECIAALQHPYSIIMHGMTESLNLSVSAAISLFDATNRKRELLAASGDLTPSEYQHAQAYYYMQSVNYRLLEHFQQLPDGQSS